MKTNFKLFERMVDNYEVIATNSAYFSWEYDSYSTTAQVLLDKATDELFLKMRYVHTKSGIGAGSYPRELEFLSIGTLQKPNLGVVRTLLAKHGKDHKFSRFWQDDEGNKMSLGDLIKLHKPEKPKRQLKHIEPIATFQEPKTKDIQLVQYSERSYALFGMGTKDIKDELLALGCKYNRFLTDPVTGEKKAGWIFPNGKLDKIKELL